MYSYSRWKAFASHYQLASFTGCGAPVSVSVAYTRKRSDYADVPCGDTFRTGSEGGIETERAICEACFNKTINQ
jgi:hypothetical protein